jgi:fructose-bisphosphate aldolase/2-amino-3,7-dideoxy-D-threo-hept-6-ulosonate synthase
LIIPFDHAAADGLLPGLLDPQKIVSDAAAGGADAVMLRPGLMDAVLEADASQLGLIFMLTGRLSRGVDHVALNTVEHAVRLGADAVCAEFKLGGPNDLENLKSVSAIAEAANRLGIPMMMTCYALAHQIEKVGINAYAQACRICEELGADLVKTALPADPDIISTCVQATRIPIILAGGSGSSSTALLAQVKQAIELGVSGAAIGRQAWGNENPIEAVKELKAIIHG